MAPAIASLLYSAACKNGLPDSQDTIMAKKSVTPSGVKFRAGRVSYAPYLIGEPVLFQKRTVLNDYMSAGAFSFECSRFFRAFLFLRTHG
ncbi:hypothetical protein BS50DRAFT_110150 [Corynespora cassiicola Philippines]|uniref:Uncharacterized protein n=1 Tax=Corynespora cassiicola Philippines TaxID=1448308 RepID=A0A2T2NDP6_CORCC|nr:hypothetical protein BS50DRAFT_110150 [Corynespora cassiicola Philippines]